MNAQNVWLYSTSTFVFSTPLALVLWFFAPQWAVQVQRVAWLAEMGIYGSGLYHAYGRPQLNRAWWSTLATHESTHYLVLGLFSFLLAPTPTVVMIAPWLYALLNFANQRPDIKARMPQLVAMQPQLLDAATRVEFQAVFAMIISWLLGSGPWFAYIFVYISFLQSRYALSLKSRAYADQMGATVDAYAARWLPAPLANIIARVKGLLRPAGV